MSKAFSLSLIVLFQMKVLPFENILLCFLTERNIKEISIMNKCV